MGFVFFPLEPSRHHGLEILMRESMRLIGILLVLGVCRAFLPHSGTLRRVDLSATVNEEPFYYPFELSEEAVEQTNGFLPSIDLKPLALAPLATMLLPVQAAYAKDGAYGILEGRIASLMHPTTMALLFLTSLYSLSLGLEWRKLRTLGDDIKQLNAQLPKLASASAPVRYPLSKVVSAVNEEIAAAGEVKLILIC